MVVLPLLNGVVGPMLVAVGGLALFFIIRFILSLLP